MEFSTVLSVAIGLIFVWLVLSLAVMNIEEWIVSKLKLAFQNARIDHPKSAG